MNSGDIMDLLIHMIFLAWQKNLPSKICIQANQMLLKAFDSTKDYSNKIVRGLYLFF